MPVEVIDPIRRGISKPGLGRDTSAALDGKCARMGLKAIARTYMDEE